MKILALLFVLLSFSAHMTLSAAGPGTGAADFLKIPVGARETSLGGALTAAGGSANAVYYNPAGLSLLQAPEVSFTHNSYVEGVSQQWLAAACPYKTGAFGLGINYLSVPPFDAYDSADNAAGTVSAYDMALYLSWGGELPLRSKFLRSVSYGASFKHISEKLATEKASGSALDLGLLASPAVKNLRFGFAVENALAGRIEFISKSARPPVKFKTGAMYELRSSAVSAARFSLDYVFWNGRPAYIAAGMEHSFYSVFAVRMGYNTFGDISNGLNFGLGFDLSRYTGRNIGIDYSFGSTYDFGNIQKLGVTYRFGRPAAIRAISRMPVETALSTATAGSAREIPIGYYSELLRTGSLYQRRGAVAELGERGGEDAFALLLSLLKDGNPVIVMDTVGVLAGFRDLRVIEPFIALFNVKNANVRLAAVSGLARYRDERVFKALQERLEDKQAPVRSRAAGVLGEWGDARATKSLQAALRKEKSGKAQRAMITALKKLDAETQGEEP